ncbi:hypothetical protein [Flavobacterium aestuarii]|uniref:hypothetical protein n=1 Tax=Flavobacterium aestuarii TaxID=3149227 RepID=UPI0032B4E6C4
MEFNKMEALLEKYFEGETSIAEENELKNYFLSADAAPHLEQYKPLFGYFAEAKNDKSSKDLPLIAKRKNAVWLSIAASIAVLAGAGAYYFYSNDSSIAKQNQELGTYQDPKKAFEATQKALAMLSANVNVGVEGVQYLQEYSMIKEKVFIE